MSLRTCVGTLAGFALVLLLSACASAAGQHQDAASGVTFVVVRHAEKASDGGKDPGLSEAGTARAQVLASRLRRVPVRAAYATAYRRTQLTAAPAAQAHGLDVTTYDADRPADQLAAQLRRDHAQGHVLIVGHSNTAPQIAAALCACTVAAMDDAEFDRLMTVRIGSDGAAVFSQERY